MLPRQFARTFAIIAIVLLTGCAQQEGSIPSETCSSFVITPGKGMPDPYSSIGGTAFSDRERTDQDGSINVQVGGRDCLRVRLHNQGGNVSYVVHSSATGPIVIEPNETRFYFPHGFVVFDIEARFQSEGDGSVEIRHGSPTIDGGIASPDFHLHSFHYSIRAIP